MDLNILRHSLSHIMAHAIQDLYPGTKFGIGPAIENGFYYDFEFNQSLKPEDLPKIEKRIKEIIKKDIVFEKKEITKKEAKELFKEQQYKLELIQEITEETVSVYTSGNFKDLCKGPHIKSSKQINPESFKLTKIAGAYWKGSEKNKMLTRIYGTAFDSKKDLETYLKMLEEAQKNDHRVLGEKLDLFMFDEKIGKGLPLWLPNGYFVRKMIEDYMYKTEKENGYLHVLTPILAKEDLYKISGHLSHYKNEMYAPIEIENEKYYLRPMNCPHHHSIYSHRLRSYKDLPIRIAEFGTVYRYEKSGVLSGLIRVRGFTQNDSHIYGTKETLKKEISSILKIFKKVYKDFKISDYWFRLSLPDFKNKEKYGDIENKEIWEEGSEVLKNVLKELKINFTEAIGEASFYGPKIDIQTKDIYGKEDTIATIQVDYYSAPKFNLYYIDKDGSKKPPVIIHRAILGSFDRFFALLLEKTAGNLPLWLSPIQVSIIPITSKHVKYAKEIAEQLKENNIRFEIKNENESISKKIRIGETQRIPYLLIIGDKEKKAKSVAVRKRGKGDIGMVKLNKFIEKVKIESDQKS